MKLNQKFLSLAVLGLAFAAPAAHADIFAGNSGTGNGELFLNVWSDQGTAGATADDVGYTLDLGTTINTFASNAVTPVLVASHDSQAFTLSFAADTRLTNFLNNLAAGSKVYYQVLGFDSVGSNRLFTTVSSADTPLLQVTTLNSITANAVTGITNINNQANAQNGTAAGTAINNSNTAVFGDAAYAGDKGGGNQTGPQLGNLTAFNTAALLGQKVSFDLLYNASTVNGQGGDANGNAFVQQFGHSGYTAYWQLASNGALSYNVVQAVPEADTWAMFAAGLIAVGAIARRRLSV